jgi:hypothetical protein
VLGAAEYQSMRLFEYFPFYRGSTVQLHSDIREAGRVVKTGLERVRTVCNRFQAGMYTKPEIPADEPINFRRRGIAIAPTLHRLIWFAISPMAFL